MTSVRGVSAQRKAVPAGGRAEASGMAGIRDHRQVSHSNLVRQRDEWRILRRRFRRLGPDVALGSLPSFLRGLGGSDE